MRRTAITLIGALIALSGCTAAGARPMVEKNASNQSRGSLTWRDEFNGSTLDTSHWSTGWFGSGVTKPVNGAETACYAPSHVTVAGGYLDLRLTKDSCTVAGHTYPMTTGSISSNGHFSFTNGTLKARVFIDGDTQGVWNWP